MSNTIHSCGYHCQMADCVRAQRDELVAKYVAQPVQPAPAAQQKDAVLQASIDFIASLTGMTPPDIEVAPHEVFAPFKTFADKVCAIFSRDPVAQADCTRSHPHENMGVACELRTVIARLENEKAHQYAAQAEPLSDSIAQPPKGLKLAHIEPGDIVEFQGAVFKVVCYGDHPKTLNLHVYPKTRNGDQWINVPAADLKHVAGAQG